MRLFVVVVIRGVVDGFDGGKYVRPVDVVFGFNDVVDCFVVDTVVVSAGRYKFFGVKTLGCTVVVIAGK